jgi:biotin carboxyl carrier protein
VGRGDEQQQVELTVLSDRPTLAVLIEGRVLELVPVGPNEASARGSRSSARLLDPGETRRRRQNQASSATTGNITAPMPGRIVKLALATGQAVTRGQPALVIEAMKMENDLVCREDGVVQRVLVKPGDTVERGALLVEIA